MAQRGIRNQEASSLQQLFSLVSDIVSTLFRSAIFSVAVATRLVYRFASSSVPSFGYTSSSSLNTHSDSNGSSSTTHCPLNSREAFTLYEGRVWHERRRPVPHKFFYNVRYALVNMDCPPSWFKSAAARHHMDASQARSIAGTRGSVYLLTVPTSVGYEQNPLSVYYCFNDDETSPHCCIAEVTNTPWAERVTFVFDAKGDTVAKPLHVSPFMDMLGTWQISSSVPGKDISISITVEHPVYENYFNASLYIKRIESRHTNVEAFFWLMPHKTALGIYWQALWLWWKGLQFYQHPKYVDGPAYRTQAVERDRELSQSGICSNAMRQYTWHEANWPWQ